MAFIEMDFASGGGGTPTIETGTNNTKTDVGAAQTKNIVVGNIGSGKNNVVVGVSKISLRCNSGDYGEINLEEANYDSTSGNIIIKVYSSTSTGRYQSCEWFAFY